MRDMKSSPREEIEARRKRLYFRCRHRGTKELDLLLGGFAERHLAKMTDEQIGCMEALLECTDHEIYAWIVGKQDVPSDHDHDVMALLRNFSIDL